MTEQNVDTVTPLDGDGSNVVDPTVVAPDNVSPEDYETRGQTTVATRRGYAFVPSNKDLPMITSAGANMTKEDAEAVVAEANGRVFIVTPDDENKES